MDNLAWEYENTGMPVPVTLYRKTVAVVIAN